MISFYKLEQIIKIWMESIKTDKDFERAKFTSEVTKNYFCL